MFYYIMSYSFIMILFIFFFFKQKTAYEMRISDWSSDVCSSDLHQHRENADRQAARDDRPGEVEAHEGPAQRRHDKIARPQRAQRQKHQARRYARSIDRKSVV